ncbi:MAG TPA: 6,7-dimethyl-8-ribityllumazine synthase [Candidatus Nanopelagicales bacterium]
MSGSGAPTPDDLDAEGLRVAIVASSWHAQVMDGLIASATAACTRAGAVSVLYRVPGTFELPLAAQVAARAGFDAVVALGVVIRGGTPHFEYVCDAATSGLSRVALDTGVPVGFGVLTCDDDAQALDRAGLPGSREDKGTEAAQAALALALTLPTIRRPGSVQPTGFAG